MLFPAFGMYRSEPALLDYPPSVVAVLLASLFVPFLPVQAGKKLLNF